MRDFHLCNGLDKPAMVKQKVVKIPWKPPEHGTWKINVDATVNEALDYIGVGVVIRDGFGVVVTALARRTFSKFSPQVGECLAVRRRTFLSSRVWHEEVRDGIRYVKYGESHSETYVSSTGG